MNKPTQIIRVYVAGPIAIGDQFQNVRRAIDAGELLLNAGLVPFIPHLDCLWHMIYPHTGDEWLAWDYQWLDLCDCTVRLPGESAGSDKEVLRTKESGKKVFYSVQECVDFYTRIGVLPCLPKKSHSVRSPVLSVQTPYALQRPQPSQN